VDIESFPARDNSDYASMHLSLVLDIIKYAGGGIPLIVENNLNDDAAERPLGDAPLAMLAATLKDIPIYVTGDIDLVDAPGDVEGKCFGLYRRTSSLDIMTLLISPKSAC
jgi:hypothetical protein